MTTVDHLLPSLDAACRPRDMYRVALGAQCPPTPRPLVEALNAELLEATAPEVEPATPQWLRHRALAWADAATEGHRRVWGQATHSQLHQVLVPRAVLAFAPLALTSGAWLQRMTSPANADDPVALAVLARYASDLGAGRPHASRGHAYLALLRRLGIADHAAPTAFLANDRRIDHLAFHLPGTVLMMSRCPDDFWWQILGVDLCLRTVGLVPVAHVLRLALPDAADWDAIDLRENRPLLTPAVPDPVMPDGTGPPMPRPDTEHDQKALVQGFQWTLDVLQRWDESLAQDLRLRLDASYEMGELLRDKARQAAVYHQNHQLAGRPLSRWLEECHNDPAPLMAALAAGRLVRPDDPESSPLINALISPQGPMFRIFTRQDVAVIQRWIASLPHSTVSRVPRPAPPGDEDHRPGPGRRTAPDQAPADRRPTGLREAYHLLQRRTETPALREYALDYVHQWLNGARRQLRRDGQSPHQLPRTWPAQGLRAWLAGQHERHARQFHSGDREALPSREALIDSTVQLAPLTLIDGSWLQGFTDYAHGSSDAGHFLFQIYWDELGNGRPDLNHPLIFRRLLTEMGVQVPPTGSRDFARSPLFRDASFRLPVYWLSIGRHTTSFLPEILGLNVAMELSGVGGAYRQSHKALKAHGFSTRFVDIHNTIDNVATGHSAWAADAVDAHMLSLPLSQQGAEPGGTWDRIRIGYRSLTSAPATRRSHVGDLASGMVGQLKDRCGRHRRRHPPTARDRSGTDV
ncbi:iron-containing redox enzyme family protein [Thermomonospora umbrina]|nr:iron-containing redox enzyme family protein [Thermomonospora umbrina]